MYRNGLITVVAVTLVMASPAFAQKAKVVDKKDVEVSLSKVTMTHIEVTREESGAVFKIPMANLSRIAPVGDGKNLVFTMTDGNELRGSTSNYLQGEWELGEYTVPLSNVKSVDFPVQTGKATTAALADQPDGVVLTCKDNAGTSIEVYGASFNFTYSYLASGRWTGLPPIRTRKNNPRQFLPMEIDDLTVSIPFAKIKSVVLQPPASKSYGATPTARVTTTDTKLITGKVAAYGEENRRLTGTTVFGDFSLKIERVARMDFDHSKDKNPTTEYFDRDLGYPKKLESGFTLRATTWDDKTYVFTDGCVFDLDNGHEWDDKSTSLILTIGESQNTVAFGKIRTITFDKKGTFKGQLATSSGATVAISSLSKTSHSHVGGKTKEFGLAYVALKHVKKIEVGK